MNEFIINEIAKNLNIKTKQIKTVIKLLEDGNTIPFIARYRKEATEALDEEQIRKIDESYQYQVNLTSRKEDVIRLIDEKGMLTDEIKNNILNCTKLIEVEDIYRPYKEKKKTKATEAINFGLEPLAKIIMSPNSNIDPEIIAQNYLNENVHTKEEAITGAKYIISEWISDNAKYRLWIRNYLYKFGLITSKIKKNAEDNLKIYEMYYDYQESIKNIKPHRILAINRGEKEGILNISIKAPTDDILNYLEKRIIKNEGKAKAIIEEAIQDSYKRLIFPSIEREIRTELKEKAEEQAIEVFGKNLEKLLLTPPMKDKNVLGLDPAYRTGCKLAVVDNTSNVKKITVIYPHEPKNMWEESKNTIKKLIKDYDIDLIAIGNGTASRESEKLISEIINEYHEKEVKYAIVNEAGASVYSASPLAIEEFPDLHVEQRSAISIARRLQDALNELVKIDSKSIGVGQYQHDVNQKKLDNSLNFVVTKVVNNVGININTASKSILKYISGMTKTSIDKLINYRETSGKIKSRSELKKLKILSDKTYEQAIGFMRIFDGDNPLDKTSIHPESYEIAKKLLDDLNCQKEDIGSPLLIEKLASLNPLEYSKNNNIDIYTLNDIINSLKLPTRDFREDFEKPILKSDILSIDNLSPGMELVGTVRNVVDFGAFIDIGLKNDGLVHISKITNKYIKHPLEILNVGDIVTVYVDEIFKDKNKVSLTMIKP